MLNFIVPKGYQHPRVLGIQGDRSVLWLLSRMLFSTGVKASVSGLCGDFPYPAAANLSSQVLGNQLDPQQMPVGLAPTWSMESVQLSGSGPLCVVRFLTSSDFKPTLMDVFAFRLGGWGVPKHPSCLLSVQCYCQTKAKEFRLHFNRTIPTTAEVRKLLSKVTLSIATVKGQTSNTLPWKDEKK